MKKIIYDIGGGFIKPIKALQVGGPLGGVLMALRDDMLAGKITVTPEFDAAKVRALMTDVAAPAAQ